METYTVTFMQRRGYLHALVTGTNSAQNVAAYLEEVLRECQARAVRHVLIEERLEGRRLSFGHVYRLAAQGGDRALRHVSCVAYVDANAEDDAMKFAETVAVNRGLRVQVFRALAEAQAWIEAQVAQG